jgi:hypothetical protein
MTSGTGSQQMYDFEPFEFLGQDLTKLCGLVVSIPTPYFVGLWFDFKTEDWFFRLISFLAFLNS